MSSIASSVRRRDRQPVQASLASLSSSTEVAFATFGFRLSRLTTQHRTARFGALGDVAELVRQHLALHLQGGRRRSAAETGANRPAVVSQADEAIETVFAASCLISLKSLA